MDKEEVIKLDASLIDDGKNLLKMLDGTSVKPSSAFWIYFHSAGSWRLIIASRFFSGKDLRERYKELIDIIKNASFVRLKLSDISLLVDDDDLVNLLKIAIKTPSDAMADIKFTANTINGVFIDDAYIYRLY